MYVCHFSNNIKSSFESISLIYGFTQFIQLGADFSELAGFAARLGHMIEVMSEIRSNKEIELASTEVQLCSNQIEFKNITIYAPNSISGFTRKCLVSNFNLTIQPGEHTICMGPSGCGKTWYANVLF